MTDIIISVCILVIVSNFYIFETCQHACDGFVIYQHTYITYIDNHFWVWKLTFMSTCTYCRFDPIPLLLVSVSQSHNMTTSRMVIM